ncbi:MAG: PAS domain S-box protein [Coriobacteriia bacterium]|nr:PAS domain S-box protein [Coriobacteriia bacterium]
MGQTASAGTEGRPIIARRTALLLVVAIAFMVGIVAIGTAYYQSQKSEAERRVNAELSAVADLKARQISQWREDQLAVARFLSRDILANEALVPFLVSRESTAPPRVVRWLEHIRDTRGAHSVALLAADRRVIYNTSTDPLEVEADLAAGVLASGEATISDLYRDSKDNIRIDVVLPLFSSFGASPPIGVLVMHRDPAQFLYPTIQSWPTASRTAESLLVERQGSRVLFLNTLRHRAGTALRLSVPVTDTAIPAVRAVLGETGVVAGTDYRGVPVLSALRHIPDSPWYLVAKVDESEAFASLYEIGRATIFAVALLVGLCLFGVGVAWRQRSAEFYRRELAAERERASLSARYDMLSRFANDAILVVDTDRRLVEANDAAVQLYGYGREVLLGMCLDDLRSADEDPSTVADFERIMAERIARFETSHTRRDGIALTVEVSARVVESSEGDLIVAIVRDVTRERIEAEELRSTREFLEKLVDYANAPIIVWSPDGTITRFNHAFERLTGTDAVEIVGKPLGVLFPDESREASLALIARTLEGEAWETVEIPVRNADGTARTALWNSANVYADDGTTLLATIAQGQDVTDRVAAERVLRRRTEDLTRSNSELEQFAYVASHDLQEPLRMIASYTQLLQKRYAGRLDADADEFIAYAVDGATRMQTLINELLAFSRVGTRTGSFARTDLDDLMSRVASSLSGLIAEAGATLRYESLPSIVCDGGQIERVLQNLVGNALKFRGDRSPEVVVSAERGDGEWLLSVVDNGIGIEAQYQERVFVIFQRLHARSEYEGTGMGLAICKRIIERHGGRLWVESEPGQGSTFHFTIPDMRESDRDG